MALSRSPIQLNKPSPYLKSLNKRASDGDLKDRAVGRDVEINKLSASLLRRRKPNCILVGEAGTGKTAIVEELAHRINEKSTTHLQNFEIFELDLNGLIAGTKNRGEFEQRMHQIINILGTKNDKDKILFIDEFHNAFTKDGSEDKVSLLSILKPALARGSLRCIGATTYDEYMKNILPDGAFNRRFTCINVPQLSDESTLEAILSVKKNYEDFHKCVYSLDSIKTCISISNRYFHYRSQPDKSLDLIDEIGSNIAILNKQKLRDPNCKVSKQDVINFCVKYLKLNVDGYSEEIESSNIRLTTIQNELSQQIIGQSHAIKTLCKALMRKQLGFYNSKRPIASFLLLGPSASGKTKLSRLFGQLYFDSILCLDMSEYQEQFSVSSLIGAPPGYVAYTEGGLLTNFIKRNPYSLILFDQLDKAHPNLINLLLQILEDGRLKDNSGKLHDFTNSIIIMTSSITSDVSNSIGFFSSENEEHEARDVNNNNNNLKMLTMNYNPEFINRIDENIEFDQLSELDLREIVKKHIVQKLSEVLLKYPIFDEVIKSLKIDVHIDNIFEMTEKKNARELTNNAEKYVIDLFVEKILTSR